MNILMMLAAAALLLGPLIAIHEFGHYIVARMLGVKVLVYSIGFGPKLLRWTSKKSGIDYRLSLLPLGGYVRMLDEREGAVEVHEQHRAFNRQNPFKRIAIVAAGPLINLILAVLLFWCLYLPTSEQLNTRIGQVLPSTPAAQVDLKVGDRIVAIDGKPTGNWEKINYALLSRMGESGHIDIQVQRDAQTLNKALVVQHFIQDNQDSPLTVLGFKPYQFPIPTTIGEVVPNGAAARQGLKVGDRILKVDDTSVADWYQVVDVVQKSPEKLLHLTVLRGTTQMVVAVMPQAQKNTMGKTIGVIGAGAVPQKMVIPKDYVMQVHYSPMQALVLAVNKTGQLSAMTVEGIYKMIRGLIGLDNLSGPITIAKIAGQSAQMGWQAFLSLMAMMSVSLGVLNLLPIPMLDGGHLVYYFIELLRGRPVSEKVQVFGLKIGMALLGSMMLLALFNDIIRF